nr:hypothetical protein [Rhabdothermincola sediminis]
MGFIEKRSGRYRARYRDPLGRQRSETFTRKADAERFIREMQVDIERGRWIDPAGADLALGTWAEEFLSLARRLSPSTQETYARDLNRYVLPRFGSYRIGRLPADEIENWLNDDPGADVVATGPVAAPVEPVSDLHRVEAHQVAPLDERDAPFEDQAADVSGVDAEELGDGGDVEQAGRQLVGGAGGRHGRAPSVGAERGGVSLSLGR